MQEDLSGLINHAAELTEKIEALGVDKLQEELQGVRDQIKSTMMNQLKDKAYDEVSGWTAKLSVRQSEQFNLEKLEPLLGEKRGRYIKEMVDITAVKVGIENGDLSRPVLEKHGAITKTPKSVALYLSKEKETNDVQDS